MPILILKVKSIELNKQVKEITNNNFANSNNNCKCLKSTKIRKKVNSFCIQRSSKKKTKREIDIS